MSFAHRPSPAVRPRCRTQILTNSDGAAFKETPDRIRLTRFTYDPMGPSPVQTFPVVPEIIKMGIPVSDVVFAFNSNWGGNLTCIYRVSVWLFGVTDLL